MVKKTKTNKKETNAIAKTKVKDIIKNKEEVEEKNKKAKKRENIAFQIVAIFCILIFSLAIAPKSLQNDTFYTIKIGQLIRENGIDYVDHYSWHTTSDGSPLPYTYPHWLYDVGMSMIFDGFGGEAGFGFDAIYYSTCILTAIMGIMMYITSRKITKNDAISFIFTLGQLYFIKPYIAARAQLVTFILFIITIFFIEKFIEKPKAIHVIALLVIPTLIANLHAAVFPFYFVLFLPYITEFAIAQVLEWHIIQKLKNLFFKVAINNNNKKLKKVEGEKAEKVKERLRKLNKAKEKSDEKYKVFLTRQKERLENPYKLRLEKNNHVPALVIVMLVALFTGLLTPLKDIPYTYTYRTMQGNTTQNINEHLPLTLIDNKPVLILLGCTIAVIALTKTKIKARDLFFIGGLTLLALMSRRQISMLALIAGLFIARLASDFIMRTFPKLSDELKEYTTTIVGEVLVVLLIVAISYYFYKGKKNDQYITGSYPVGACDWIVENLDYKNIRIFNDYNYGSYMLYRDIPVYVDSRCDLYTPQFNGEYNKDNRKWQGGSDYFTEYLDVSSIANYYDNVFTSENINYVITKNNSKLNMLIKRDTEHYEKVHTDGNFVIYHRIENDSDKNERIEEIHKETSDLSQIIANFTN